MTTSMMMTWIYGVSTVCSDFVPHSDIITCHLACALFSCSLMWQVMLDNEMILSMLRHVVAGLSFLHSAEPPIVHQELRSLKILLDSSCRAHLTDFQQEVVHSCCRPRCRSVHFFTVIT